jgi:hypothetical protein
MMRGATGWIGLLAEPIARHRDLMNCDHRNPAHD